MKPGLLSAFLVCAVLLGCQSAPKPAPQVPVAPVTASAPTRGEPEIWVKTELYFGLAPADAEGLGLAAAEGTWRSFLDEEVTPRFPDGFTVVDAYGQWRAGEKSAIERERSRVLMIVHLATPAKRAGIQALCEAYKKRTGEQSVLVLETPVSAPKF